MKLPPLFITACLLLWGWQTGHLVFAVPMALVIELAGTVRWRWAITRQDFYRVSDLSSLVLAAVVIYQFNRYAMHGVYYVLEWLPYVFYLLLFTQTWSDHDGIPYSAFFISLRKQIRAKPDTDESRINFGLVYALTTVLAASSGNQDGIYFFSAVCVLAVWLLAGIRSRCYSIALWICMLLLTVMLGFFAQTGMRHLQRSMEHLVMGLLEEYFWQNRDPDRATTAIGSLGRYKLSDHIRIRVESDHPLPADFLLHEASYNYFNLGTWTAQKTGFKVVDPGSFGIWPLTDSSVEAENTIRISTRLRRSIGVAPMPYHGLEFTDPGTLEVQRNEMGAIQLEGKPGLINYSVTIGNSVNTSPTTDTDLMVPEQYLGPISQLMQDEGLMQGSDTERAKSIQKFFLQNFSYQLVERSDYPGKKPLLNFLLRDRRGHCEYFATSTVLMLRAAGIPARYSIGYSIQEYSEIEQRYVARARHAHAWATAWIDGQWQVLDTTPPSWDFLEDQQANSFQPVVDLFSWLRFLYSELMHDEGVVEDTEISNDWLWLILPLAAWLIWSMTRRQRVDATHGDAANSGDRHGLDSEFFALLEELKRDGYRMQDGESTRQWLHRLSALHTRPEYIQRLLALLPLHDRYRFDPQGLDHEQRRQLRDDCKALMR